MDVVRFAGMADLAFHLRRERLLPISWRDWQDKAMWRFSDLYKLPLTSAHLKKLVGPHTKNRLWDLHTNNQKTKQNLT
jgi:hypothetical protein